MEGQDLLAPEITKLLHAKIAKDLERQAKIDEEKSEERERQKTFFLSC